MNIRAMFSSRNPSVCFSSSAACSVEVLRAAFSSWVWQTASGVKGAYRKKNQPHISHVIVRQ
jgi:hypothetical protein